MQYDLVFDRLMLLLMDLSALNVLERRWLTLTVWEALSCLTF
jgi:hypothetical protein